MAAARSLDLQERIQLGAGPPEVVDGYCGAGTAG